MAMLRVYVAGYFVGEARSMADADALAVGYAAWLASSGLCRVPVLPFRYERERRVVTRGELDVWEGPSTSEPVKGAVGGVANP